MIRHTKIQTNTRRAVLIAKPSMTGQLVNLCRFISVATKSATSVLS
nr:MAG TPA: hypothetical protein [Caudoviricetes sp.]